MRTKPNTAASAVKLRRRAEARLRTQQSAAAPRTEADTKRLLHELQVHQVELELQNAELGRAHAEAEASAEKFADLYDFAPLGYVTLNDDAAIRELNHTAARLLGKARARMTGTPFVNWVARRDREKFLRHLSTASATEGKVTAEVDLALEDGQTVPVHLSTICLQPPSAQARQYRTAITDISTLKKAEQSRELLVGILERLNNGGGLRPLCRDILGKIRAFVGVQAAAIRLRQGDDFPYFEQSGFAAQFIRAENSLCCRDPSGQLARDEQGRPILACMCGTVLLQRTDLTKPFFSEGGSFWTNSTTGLLATTTEADRQGHTRNRCNRAGYESVALIPLRSGVEVVGLLQLNDRQTGRFTPEMICFCEGLGLSIGVALSRQRAEWALQERMKELNCLYGISALLELPGISLEKILKGTVRLPPPAWQFPEITVARIILERGCPSECGRYKMWG